MLQLSMCLSLTEPLSQTSSASQRTVFELVSSPPTSTSPSKSWTWENFALRTAVSSTHTLNKHALCLLLLWYCIGFLFRSAFRAISEESCTDMTFIDWPDISTDWIIWLHWTQDAHTHYRPVELTCFVGSCYMSWTYGLHKAWQSGHMDDICNEPIRPVSGSDGWCLSLALWTAYSILYLYTGAQPCFVYSLDNPSSL